MLFLLLWSPFWVQMDLNNSVFVSYALPAHKSSCISWTITLKYSLVLTSLSPVRFTLCSFLVLLFYAQFSQIYNVKWYHTFECLKFLFSRKNKRWSYGIKNAFWYFKMSSSKKCLIDLYLHSGFIASYLC